MLCTVYKELLLHVASRLVSAVRRKMMQGKRSRQRQDVMCREPAHIVDFQRGGLVCAAHAPAAAATLDTVQEG
jgi:hypothetical protein